jgi:hypothetical protein
MSEPRHQSTVSAQSRELKGGGYPLHNPGKAALFAEKLLFSGTQHGEAGSSANGGKGIVEESSLPGLTRQSIRQKASLKNDGCAGQARA